MKEKTHIKENITLVLKNTIEINMPIDEISIFNKRVYTARNYLKNKGAEATEILVTRGNVDDIGVFSTVFVQSDRPIVEDSQYKFRENIEKTNCLFSRFAEHEQDIKYAYQKMLVYAFENDIALNGEVYTVFIKKYDDGKIIADIFMPVGI